jgi:hypothetical protein
MDALTASKAAMADTLREIIAQKLQVYADLDVSRTGLSARVRLWYVTGGRLAPIRPDCSLYSTADERAAVYRDAGCDPATLAWKVQGCGTSRTFEALAQAAHWAGFEEPYLAANAIRVEML